MKKGLHATMFITMICLCCKADPEFPDSCFAPDFTATDINGNSWNLYDLLDQGKTVFIDFSTTWCPPCWTYHTGGAFETLYNTYGPNGTGEVMVFLIEIDPNTTLADLQGTGGSTEGDWVSGTSYPIIDNASLANGFGFFYYPTIFMITPDRVYRNNGTLGPISHYNRMIQHRILSVPTPDAGISYGCNENDSLYSCSSVNASVRLFNYSSVPLTSATLEVNIDGSVVQTAVWTGSLSTYEHAYINIANITSAIPGYKSAVISIASVNGGADTRANNNVSTIPFKLYPPVGNAIPAENFSSLTFPPAGWFVENGGSWWGMTWDRSQYGYNGSGAARIPFLFISDGEIDVLLMPSLDLSGYQSANLSYMRSHQCHHAADHDRIGIYASSDCGVSWQLLDLKVCPQLASVGGYSAAGWIPSGSGDWIQDIVPLNSMLGHSNVLIKFEGISGGGDMVYLDNVGVNLSTEVGDISESVRLLVYPNPASEVLTAEVFMNHREIARIEIMNELGEVVVSRTLELAAGQSNPEIEIKTLNTGVYIFSLNMSLGRILKSFIIQR